MTGGPAGAGVVGGSEAVDRAGGRGDHPPRLIGPLRAAGKPLAVRKRSRRQLEGGVRRVEGEVEKEGFVVFALDMIDDPVLAPRCEQVGCIAAREIAADFAVVVPDLFWRAM